MCFSMKNRYIIISILSFLATVWSLYYWYFWDIYLNMFTWDFFNTQNWIIPCEMCRYIRIAQYPILVISLMAIIWNEYFWSKKYIIALSIFWLIVSIYKSFLEYWIIEKVDTWFCSTTPWASCSSAVYLFWSGVSLSLVGAIIFVLTLVLLVLPNKESSK